jgi:hypothetical protein
MSSTECPELKTVAAHYQHLITALSGDPTSAADALIDKKFIRFPVLLLREMYKGDTPTGKATILVESVRKEIEAAPKRFIQFLEILSETTCAKELVDSLRSTYQSELRSRMRLLHDIPVSLTLMLNLFLPCGKRRGTAHAIGFN